MTQPSLVQLPPTQPTCKTALATRMTGHVSGDIGAVCTQARGAMAATQLASFEGTKALASITLGCSRPGTTEAEECPARIPSPMSLSRARQLVLPAVAAALPMLAEKLTQEKSPRFHQALGPTHMGQRRPRTEAGPKSS
mmetsp:Transcript_69331/g.137030  ORF Transcript_69331/g.137030 Transcript_69331/m.137030 type:complete len:139 (+) Transcript_69331:226-642(+)